MEDRPEGVASALSPLLISSSWHPHKQHPAWSGEVSSSPQRLLLSRVMVSPYGDVIGLVSKEAYQGSKKIGFKLIF